MRRRMDAYLEPLVEPERFAFYQAVCEFADSEIAPSSSPGSASTACCQRRRFAPSQIWASSVSRSQRSTVGRVARRWIWC